MIFNAPNLWKEKVTEDSEVTFSNMERLLSLLQKEQICWLDPVTCSLGFTPSVLSCSSATAFSPGQVSVPAPWCSVCSGDTSKVWLFSAVLPLHVPAHTHTSVVRAPALYPHFLFFHICVWFFILSILWKF